ncbi:MAG TPA: hypothetical protein VHM66_06345 [Solirubrobacterales bacterium]|jgi:hypothetical protein|nr:hypothetical protein [Solirubrobacterales bacterium]
MRLTARGAGRSTNSAIGIDATTEDGVLEVTVPLPKIEEKKTVEIQPKSKSD